MCAFPVVPRKKKRVLGDADAENAKEALPDDEAGQVSVYTHQIFELSPKSCRPLRTDWRKPALYRGLLVQCLPCKGTDRCQVG